jgi:hypothetical protein
MAWTQQGTGITWGDVEDPIHWADGSGARLDYNPDDPSNWWRNWQTPATPDYSGLGQNYDPMQSGGGSVAPTMVGGGINAAPEGKTYYDVLKDVLMNPQGPQGANPADTITRMARSGYLQSLPGFDQNHWSTVVEPYVAEIMGDFNSNRTANMGVLSTVLPAVGGMVMGAYGAGAGAAGAAEGAGASAAAGGSAAGGAGYSMPAATAMSGAELGGMGLEQMGAGVWAQPGATGFLGAPSSASFGTQLGGQNYSAPVDQVQPTNIGGEATGLETNEFGGYPNDPNYNPAQQNFGPNEPMMQQDFSSPVNSGAGPAGGGGLEGMGAQGGGATGGGAGTGGFGLNADTALRGLGVGGTLYNLYQQNQFQGDVKDAMTQANSQPEYDYSQNWEQVQRYLNDPMSLLRNNPGYLASVDFVEKEGRRTAAKGGYNLSGNKSHYLADVLGKNAQKWHEAAWAPIRDAAGLQRPDQSANLGTMNLNAMNAINRSRTQAVGSLFDATGKALPDIFRMFGGE